MLCDHDKLIIFYKGRGAIFIIHSFLFGREKRKAGGDLLSSSERYGRINPPPPFLTENLIQMTGYLNQIQTLSRSSPHIS